MDGAGIAAVQRLGAAAAQRGTAFLGCPESAAALLGTLLDETSSTNVQISK